MPDEISRPLISWARESPQSVFQVTVKSQDLSLVDGKPVAFVDDYRCVKSFDRGGRMRQETNRCLPKVKIIYPPPPPPTTTPKPTTKAPKKKPKKSHDDDEDDDDNGDDEDDEDTHKTSKGKSKSKRKSKSKKSHDDDDDE